MLACCPAPVLLRDTRFLASKGGAEKEEAVISLAGNKRRRVAGLLAVGVFAPHPLRDRDLDFEIPYQPQQVRTLEAERPGRMRAVAAVGHEG